MKKNVLTELPSIILIFLFGYAGLTKLIDHSYFYTQLSIFPGLKYAALALSWILPVMELTLMALLCMPRWRIWGLYLSLALLAGFTIYLLGTMLSGTELPCSCGGVIQYLSWKEHVAFNLFFILLSTYGIYIDSVYLRHRRGNAGKVSKKNKFFIAINRLEAENPEKKR